MTTHSMRLLAAATAVLAGCGTRDGHVAMLVTDSAGVRLVVHPTGPRDTLPAGEPVLVIGREGDPRYELFRVNHVEPLSDGRILVVNAGSYELRVYSPEGEYLGAAGGEGQGPGEFRFVSAVQVLPGDTIVVNDPPARRISFFSGEPAYAGSLSWGSLFGDPPGTGGMCVFPGYLGITGRRTLVMTDWSCMSTGPTEGVRQSTFQPFLWDVETDERRPLEAVRVEFNYERPSATGPERLTPLPFAPSFGTAYAPGHVFMGLPDAYAIRVWAPDGELVAVIREEVARRPVDAALRAAHQASVSEEMRRRLQGVPYPDSLPTFGRLVVGEGQVWAAHYELPEVPLRHWSVYATSGERLGTVALPRRFELRSVVGGLAYGVTRDELDVERVEVYEVPLGETGG